MSLTKSVCNKNAIYYFRLIENNYSPAKFSCDQTCLIIKSYVILISAFVSKLYPS